MNGCEGFYAHPNENLIQWVSWCGTANDRHFNWIEGHYPHYRFKASGQNCFKGVPITVPIRATAEKVKETSPTYNIRGGKYREVPITVLH